MASGQTLTSVTAGGMVLVALLWALCFRLIVTGAPDALPPLLFAALRALLAGVLLLVGLTSFNGTWRWPSGLLPTDRTRPGIDRDQIIRYRMGVVLNLI